MLLSNPFYGIYFDVEINILPEDEIQADVQLTIDATNSDDIDESIAAFEGNFDDDWDIISECTSFIYN